MSRYQPPHMRQRPPTSAPAEPSRAGIPAPARRSGAPAGGAARPPISSGATGQAGPSSAPRWQTNNPRSDRLVPSQRDWSCSSSPSSSSARPPNPTSIPAARRGIQDIQDPRGGRGLASPARDIKPMRAGAGGAQRKAELEMEMMQSVSRSGGDGAEGDAIKNWDTQERYRAYIDQRIDTHYAKFSTPRHTVPSVKGKAKASMGDEEMESLGSIVLLFRKLREGVVASSRIDPFAIEVFESSARFAILAQNRPQLLSALSGLVPGLYRALGDSLVPRDRGLDHVVNEIASLDIRTSGDGNATGEGKSKSGGDTRAEFTSLLLLYHLVCSGRTAYQELLWDLTAPRKGKLRARPGAANGEESKFTERDGDGEAFVGSADLRFVLRAAQVSADETFSPIAYFALITPAPSPSPNDDAPPRGSPYERALFAWAAPDVRLRSWNVLRKAYMSASLEWAGQALGLDATEVEGWVGEHAGAGGGRVEGGMVKLR